MVNKGPDEEPQSLPSDLLSVDTYVTEGSDGPTDVAGEDPEGAGPDDGKPGGGTAVDTQTPDDKPQDKTEQTLYETPGFKEFQASTDRQLAELKTQLEQERSTRRMVEGQASINRLEESVYQWKSQQYQALLDRGADEALATELAHQWGDLAKNAFLAEAGNKGAQTAQSTAEQQLNSQVQRTRAYTLASQYDIPIEELQNIKDPTYQEAHAKTLGRVKKLEAQIQGSTPGQQFDTATPAADVAPSDDERVLDAYAAGDDRVNLGQAKAAAERLGMRIF